MKNQEIEGVTQKVKDGTLTVKQAVNLICSFVVNNYPLFGLHKFDEDFRSEIFLSLLERGEMLLQNYNSKICCFEKYLFFYIQSLIRTKLKYHAKRSMSEKISQEQIIEVLEEQTDLYDKLNYPFFEQPKVPYTSSFPYAPRVSPSETLAALKNIKDKAYDKTILVLAIKSVFYLTDEQIDRVCKIYHIQKDSFLEIIQICRNTIKKRVEKRNFAQERRNYAYYHHKRCCRILDQLKNEDENAHTQELRRKYELQEKKYKRRWDNLTNSFKNGYLNLRPTNKTVARLLGLCERQVTYYINCAKKDAQEKDGLKEEVL